MGDLGKGLRAASFTSTGGVARTGRESAGEGRETANTGAVILPECLDTPEARRRFAKAVEAGYMEATSTGYKWLGLPKAAAAYFFEKIYCHAITDKHPNWGLLGQLFGLLRLDRAASQVHDAIKEQPWKREINKLFED